MRPLSKKSFINLKQVSRQPDEPEGAAGDFRYYYVILGFAAVAVAGYFIFVYKSGQVVPVLPSDGQGQFKIVEPQIQRALSSELAEDFPESIPLNSKVRVTESYEAAYPNSSAKQATAVFDSSKTPKQNYDFYLAWAKKNGWQVINTQDTGPVLSIYLRKEYEDINITILGKEVNVSYVNTTP